MDAAWNDDFHHSAMVRLTGHWEAYYSDYRGTPEEFIAAAKWGYLYQGQWHAWQKKPRGTPTRGLPVAAFINFLQNHDQVANSARGLRADQLTSPGKYRALTALLLLLPGTPLLFQGQEFAATSPWVFFTDRKERVGQEATAGRREFLSQFPSLSTPETRAVMPDPTLAATFQACKLDHAQREQHRWAVDLHRDLLHLHATIPC